MKFFKYFLAFILCTVIALMSLPAHAGQIELRWKAPTTPPNFATYRIHWGEKSGEYTQHQDVKKSTTSVTISNLENQKTYYFVATSVAASGQESQYSNEASLYLDVDTDKDGILDQAELHVYGTDPKLPDTDGDGINDGDEVALWKDAWNQDTDGDGQINLLDRDADDDGITDGSEIADRTNPLDADSFLAPDPDPVLELLPIAAVQASDAQEPNVPANTTDGDVTTRWSAKGDGQWIMYDIGSLAMMQEVAIAWAKGNQRKASFAVEVSVDGQAWNEVFSGDSSGTTNEFEFYTFSPTAARYLRLLGYGNSSNNWNNITEVELYGHANTVPLPIAAVQASDTQEPNIPANTTDGDVTTRWSAKGDGQWIMYDIGSLAMMQEVAIAWVKGNQRKASFAIEVSVDGQAWNEVFSGDSSGTTNEFEFYTFSPTAARYLRLLGYGNSSNNWNSITEVELYGHANTVVLPIAAVQASDANEPHVAANTIDGDMTTRWGAEGDGQWIMYDLGTRAMLNEVAIAWRKGNQRKAAFAIEVSVDGQTWKEAFSGDSSGTTDNFESHTFDAVSARYVRLVGHGNSSNSWNTIIEVKLYGLIN